MKGIFITGSSTGVGKTFIALRIVKILSSMFDVSVRKPIESDCTQSGEELIPKDALLLQQAEGNTESIDIVCKYKFSQCSSPEKAANDEDQNIDLLSLVEACKGGNGFKVIEGAGGIYSPIASSTLNSDLAKELELPIILVVKDELGAINQALMADNAAKNEGLEVLAIVLNQIDKNDLNNADAIRSYTDTKVLEFNDKPTDFENSFLKLIK